MLQDLSPQHKVYDICDELQGNYPKDFKWSSWHVSCKYFRTMILKSQEELINEINNGQNLSSEASQSFVLQLLIISINGYPKTWKC